MVDVDENADSSAQCPLHPDGHHAVDDASVLLEELDFTIDVDENVIFSLSGPMATVDVVPDVGANYEVRVNNHGSDEATFFLDIVESPSLTTVLVSASGVTVAAGEVGTWTVNTKGDVDLSGLFQQSFATSYNGQTSNVVVDIQLLEVDGLDIVPPSENRVLIAPGSTNSNRGSPQHGDLKSLLDTDPFRSTFGCGCHPRCRCC